MAYTISTIYRTKSEAKDAIRKGEVLHVVKDGAELTRANGGPFTIRVKLAHYKEWSGEAYVTDGRIRTIR